MIDLVPVLNKASTDHRVLPVLKIINGEFPSKQKETSEFVVNLST